MNMHVTKSLSGVAAALVAMILHVPTLVHKSAIVALGFLVMDTVTGYFCAAFDRNWSSNLMRVKLVAKASQYSLLLTCCAGAAVLADNWSFVLAGWWAIIAIEFHSILENLIKWQKFGVDLGPAGPLLTKLSQFFNAGQIQGSAIIVPPGVITPGGKDADTQIGNHAGTAGSLGTGASSTGADRPKNGA